MQQKFYQRNKYTRNISSKILWTILYIDKVRTQTNGPKNMKLYDDALNLIPER